MNTLPKQKPVRFGERIDASVIAQLAGCSRQHLTRKCRAGKVPGAYQSKGGHWRARWSQWLAEWVVENSRLPAASGIVEWSANPAEQLEQLRRCIRRFTEVEQLKKLRSQLTRRIQKLKAIQDAPLPEQWWKDKA